MILESAVAMLIDPKNLSDTAKLTFDDDFDTFKPWATKATKVSIAAAPVAHAEGNATVTPYAFTFTREGNTSGTSAVNYAVTGWAENGTNGADFEGGVLPSGRVTFAAGETTKVVTVNVIGDTTVEANEGFTIDLYGPSLGTTLGMLTASGNVQNDDAAVAALAPTASSGRTFENFLAAVALRESSGDYTVVNSLGFLGAYQFGEGALTDIGYYQPDGTAGNDWIGGWTGKNGITSKAAFLANRTGQDTAMKEWISKLWDYAKAPEFEMAKYVGQVINGVTITPSAIIAGEHLVGMTPTAAYLTSGGTTNPTDPAGTPVAEYVKLFAGYATPYDTGITPTSSMPTTPTTVPTSTTPATTSPTTPAPDAQPSATPTRTFSGTLGDDAMVGSNGADLLDGRAGADNMKGGLGDDTYQIENRFDAVVELAASGIDTVQSTLASHTLAANVENLKLNGSAAQTGIGNALNNIITANNVGSTLDGEAGNDRLKAGKGADLMTGGAGADVFDFDFAATNDPNTYRHVTDFAVGVDTIDLRTIFSGYAGTDPLASRHMLLEANPQGGTDIYYDADGTGAGRPILITALDHVAANVLKVGSDIWI
jgi:hypothetical protein